MLCKSTTHEVNTAGAHPAPGTNLVKEHMGKLSRDDMREYMRNWRERRRTRARQMLGGKCGQCGADGAIEFDHIDPSTKKCAIAAMWTASEEKFNSEVAKCQLLCGECHKEKTARERPPVSTKHGTMRAYYKYQCRCAQCIEKHESYNNERRRQRRGKMCNFSDTH